MHQPSLSFNDAARISHELLARKELTSSEDETYQDVEASLRPTRADIDDNLESHYNTPTMRMASSSANIRFIDAATEVLDLLKANPNHENPTTLPKSQLINPLGQIISKAI